MRKSRTGKKIARAIALGLATMVTLTSVPMTVNGTEPTDPEVKEGIIVVDTREIDLSSDNLTDDTKSIVSETQAADNAADNAAVVANQAAADASAAAGYAEAAAAEATNATEIAKAADDMYQALEEGSDLVNQINAASNTSEDNDGMVENAVEAYNAATAAIGDNNGGAVKAIIDANAKKEGADTAIANAGTAVAAVGNADNGAVEAANNAIDDANASKGNLKDDDHATSSGTEGLIQAAKDAVTNIQARESAAAIEKGENSDTENGKEGSGLLKKIEDVKAKVEEANGLYTAADTEAQTTLNKISADLIAAFNDIDVPGVGAKAAGVAEESMKNALDQSGKASNALANTWDSFNAVKQLVDSGSTDVDTAATYAKNARDAADEAKQAADNAKAFAANAEVAQGIAEANYQTAQDAYNKALADLLKVYQEYEENYGKAGEAADVADKLVDGNLEEADDKGVNGEIDSFNNKVDGIVDDIDAYNSEDKDKSARVKANNAIDETNGKIEAAQDLIDALLVDKEGKDSLVTDANKKIAIANGLIKELVGEDGNGGLEKAAQDAIDVANGLINSAGDARTNQLNEINSALDALEAAKANYDKAVADRKDAESKTHTAQEWAEKAVADADAALENANKVVDEAKESAAIAALNAAKTDSKDALGRLLLNKEVGYSVTDELAKAEKGLEDAQDAKTDLEENTYNGEYYSYWRGIENEKKNDLYGADGNSGLNKQLKDSIATLEGYQDEKGHYEAGHGIGLLYSNIGWAYHIVDIGVGNRALDHWSKVSQSEYDQAVKDIARYKELTGEKTGLIATETAKKNGLQKQFNTVKGDMENASGKIKEADEELQKAADAIESAKGIRDQKQADLAKVNDFAYTTDNTLAIDEDDLDALEAYLDSIKDAGELNEYKALLAQLKKDFGPGKGDNKDFSYKTVNSETDEYANYKGADFWLFGIDWGILENADEIQREIDIENKYGAKWYKLDHIAWSDDKWHEELKNETNRACVVVCTDIDKMAVLRSTLAEAKYYAANQLADAAKAEAEAAKAKVVDADGKLLEAIAKEQEALNRYNELKALLVGADGNGGAKKKVEEDIDINGLTIGEKLNSLESGNYTSISTVDVDTVRRQLKSLVDKYEDTDKLGIITYNGPEKITGKVDKTVRGKKADLSYTPDEEDITAADEETVESDKRTDLEKLIGELKEFLRKAEEDLKKAGEELDKAVENKQIADEMYNEAQKNADEADIAARDALELAGRIAPAPIVPVEPEVELPSISTTVISSDDDDDDDDDAADDGAAAPAGFTFTGTPSYVTGTPAMTTLPGFGFTGDADGTGATGVLGVRTGGGNGAGGTEADEGGAADSRTNVASRADFGTVNKVLGSKQNKDNSQIVKKIKDNEIPLAEIPNMDDEVKMNWMWLLIIFLLGATGKKMFDEYKKKKEAEEAAKINK